MTKEIVTVAVLALAVAGCARSRPGETDTVAPELRLEGVTFRVYRGAALRAFGDARTATLRRDTSEVRAQALEATLPQPGAPVLVTAPQGEGSLATRVFQASGGVEVSRGDDRARTDRARYEPAPPGGLVLGDDPVTVEGKGYRLTGNGFTLDPAEGTIALRGGARLVAGLREAR